MRKTGLFVVALAAFALLPAEALCQSNPPPGSVPVVDGDSASATTNVAGVVRTTLNAPIPGASVHIFHLSSGRSWVTWTRDDGNFSFQALPVVATAWKSDSSASPRARRKWNLQVDRLSRHN